MGRAQHSDDAFEGLLGIRRGSHGQARFGEADVVDAFLAGRELTVPTLRSVSVKVPLRRLKGPSAQANSFCLLFDDQGRLHGVRDGQTGPFGITVCKGALGQRVLRAAAGNLKVEVMPVSHRAFLTRLAEDGQMRQALIAAGAAEREILLGLVAGGLSERMRTYLRAVAATPNTDMYVLGQPIDGHRADKLERTVGNLLDRGLLEIANYPRLGLTVDGTAVLATL